MRIRPSLRAGRSNITDAEVANASSAKGRIVAVGNAQRRVLVGADVVSEILRVKPVEAKTQLVDHARREGVVVSDGGVVISRQGIDVANLDKTSAGRRRRQIASLIRLASKKPIAIVQLIVSLNVELMIVVRLDGVGLEVVAGT